MGGSHGDVAFYDTAAGFFEDIHSNGSWIGPPGECCQKRHPVPVMMLPPVRPDLLRHFR
jgi:hypothetical protein